MEKKRLSEKVASRLRELYGARRRRREDPGEVLIRTVLSQNTSDVNSLRAFSALKKRFPTMKDLASAPVPEIEEAIRSGGLYRTKARVIRDLASGYIQGGKELTRMDDGEARRYLRSLKGVGPKTSSCVLLFAMGREVMPVDTHVYRLSRRIGLIEESVPIGKAEQELERFVPPRLRYQLHLDLIEHGRRICRPSNPRCDACVLSGLCGYARARGEGRERGGG